MEEYEKSENAGLLDLSPNEPGMFGNVKYDDTETAEKVKAEEIDVNVAHDDLSDFLSGSGRMTSTTRPLVTTVEDDENPFYSEGEKLSPSLEGAGDIATLISTGADSQVAAAAAESFEPTGDALSIGSSAIAQTAPPSDNVYESLLSSPFEKNNEKVEEILLPTKKEPKITTNLVSDSKGTCFGDFEEPAHSPSQGKRSAMEGDLLDMGSKADCVCPFSPGVWFNPDKLHPTVAELVYWRDIKKSGIFFGVTLVLLLSLKYFSVISVLSYCMLAILSITVSFRIYKNILQAVQKSHEGHPFKEYLDMNISLSHDKLKDISDVAIRHVNSVTEKLRSLVLVEDLFDTLKLFAFAWFLTYVGCCLNGMTLIILAFVSIFTLPKVYETNKVQIDAYTDIIRTKGKEVMEMINAKIPLGKKKEE